MKHLNGNILCVIDTETTGTNPEEHDIWDICVIPINDNLDIDKRYRPFQAMMKPWSQFAPGALMNAHITKAEVFNTGHDPFKVADAFDEWVAKLNLPQGKQIIPLAHNWPFDREFMCKWLGRKTFQYHFSGDYRCTYTLASFHNDRRFAMKEPYEYSRRSLGALAQRLGLDISGSHRASADCLLCLEVYKKLLFDRIF